MNAARQHDLGPTRARVLGMLQGAIAPLSVGEIADDLGLHRNSVRFHLDALVDAGFAHRGVDGAGLHGRPPAVYSATQAAPPMSSIHLLELADILLSHVSGTSEDPAAEMRTAGHSWGERLADGSIPADAVVPQLAETLAERGFGIEQPTGGLCFTRCPFRRMIDAERLPLVCAMHQGMIDGYLDASPGELAAGPIHVGRTLCTVPITA